MATRELTRRGMTVQDVMHAGVLTCRRGASLRTVAEIMAGHRVHCVVVRDDDGESGVWGLVSDLDLMAAAIARPLDEQTAEGSAATPTVLVSPDESLDRAAQLMTEHATAHLLVVAEHGRRPIGVISTLDVAEALADSG